MSIMEIEFKSFNERDTVKAWRYSPITKPKAIVQVVHGLGEHSRRYLHMILKMNDAGFVVCADVHVGHGKTAYDANTWGDLGSKGYMTTIEDEHTLRKIVTEEYPALPYIMFGHSWGSMIARNYAAKYAEGMAGLIICGASADFSNMLDLVDKTQDYIDQGRDDEVVMDLIIDAFGDMTDRYENVNTPMDWISADEGVVADHSSDPFNNLSTPMNIRLLYDMGMALKMIQGTEWAEKIPENLPIYNIAGSMDPVASYGEGTKTITRWLTETGHKDLTTKIYPGFRHEIHNEPPIRDEVEDGIIAFINKCLPAAGAEADSAPRE